MSVVLALLWPAFIVGTTLALIRLNRASCLPCSSGETAGTCEIDSPRQAG